MTGVLSAVGQPCNNGTFVMSVGASGLLLINRFAFVIGPTTAEPPLVFGDWTGAAYTTGDEYVPILTKTRGPGGITLSATFIVPDLSGASGGDHCWLGLYGTLTPGSSDAPEAVLRLPNVATRL